MNSFKKKKRILICQEKGKQMVREMKDPGQDKDAEVRYKDNNEWLETSSQWSLEAKRAKGDGNLLGQCLL